MLDFGGVLSATRLHLPPGATEIPEATQKHLCAYAVNAQRLGVVAAIAVNSDALAVAVRSLAQAAAPGLDLHVLSVPCWGAFVAALNTLLEFAQRNGLAYILYQSLELQCSASVLQKLLDHFTSNVLVVGPVLPGHTFEAGQQTLNGRTTPWNTLALWSVRKLALNGFPRIADGIAACSSNPQDSSEQADASEQLPKRRKTSLAVLEPELLGSKGWWSREIDEQRDYAVPAGVEEVTAIALLQSLLGRHRAIAVLLELPQELLAGVSWKTNWGQDEARRKWHEYKMQSKVTRPAAQLQELFGRSRGVKRARDGSIEGPHAGASEAQEEDLNCGTVMHCSSSIAPPRQVQWICLAAVGIFYFNSTAVLASAFQCMNSTSGIPSLPMMAFSGFIIGGPYLLMPISLQLTRMVTYHFDHAAGLLFFGTVLLLSHICIVLSQLFAGESTRHAVLLAARLAQGLGSGVPFQSRFVLASLSTGDLHKNLQACAFIAGDLGLGLGALLPAVTSALAGYRELREEAPELWPSMVLLVICVAFLVCVKASFPRHLHFLPDAVRFAELPGAPGAGSCSFESLQKFRKVLLVSGTTRVFVQSAIIPVVGLLMHDAQWTGQFRQSAAVAMLYLLQLPFEALASRICCMCSERKASNYGGDSNRLLFGGGGALLVVVVSFLYQYVFVCADCLQVLSGRILQLAALVIMLAVASPVNASRLYQLKDAERAIVSLEWMKAYIGRILGPFIAVLIYYLWGYGPVFTVLCFATFVVAATA